MTIVRLQFDDLTFDSDTRQLWIGKKEVRLSPKAFDLLALLIAQRPKAVSKHEIREHLWPGTFVSDSSLPSLISEIREVDRRSSAKARAAADAPRLWLRLPGRAGSRGGASAIPPDQSPNGWLIGSTAEVGASSRRKRDRPRG